MKLNGELQVQNNSAQFYEKRYSGFGLKYHTAIISEMMEGINGSILDVGCGTGILSSLYPKLNIIGIDISEAMLDRHPGERYYASADNIPFPDGYFDSVVCRSILHHLESPEKALQEIRRVLKPGGKFVCWETNKSWIANIVRKLTQHGDRFTEYHGKLEKIPNLVQDHFEVTSVKYGGFFGYCLFGFPDIIDFSPVFGGMYSKVLALDERLSRSRLSKLGFWVMVKGVK